MKCYRVVSMHDLKGFTLIELMIALVIISILAMIALPVYSQYAQRANENLAQQQLQNLAIQLDRHKARQFNYLGFATAAGTPINLPEGSTGTAIKYKVYVKDGLSGNPLLTDTTASGLSWVIKAESQDTKLATFLMTSNGIKCKNKAANSVTYAGCGSGSESW